MAPKYKGPIPIYLGVKLKKKKEEKFPWIRAWLQDVIIPMAKLKNGLLNSKRRRFAFLFLRLLPLETEENHLQKKNVA
jgi:hypothetical protein